MRLMVLGLAVAACKPQPPTTTEADTDADTDTDTDADTDSDTDTDVPDTDTDVPDTDTDPPPDTDDTDVQVPVVDCSSLPQGPFPRVILPTPRGYHGLAFDQLGNLVGGDGTNLVRATGPNSGALYVANIGSLQQMQYLPSGDLAVAVDGGGLIQRIDPAGVRTTLASGIGAYGLVIGPDGMIYTANQDQVHRVDPTAVNPPEVVVPSNRVDRPKVVAFSFDGATMYLGTNQDGNVYEIDLDANFDPVFPARLIGVTADTWHDAIDLDACGNLYVAEFWDRRLYIKPPGGTLVPLIEYSNLGSGAYGHGLAWGSGVPWANGAGGVWEATNIYVPMPYDNDRVGQYELGMPHKDFNGGVYTTMP